MSNAAKILTDDSARRDAISLHDRSILVEAGAGSGKTAVMAGRIAAMLASGIAPRTIAAVTFTELAASELLSRVREFVAELTAGKIAPELRVAFPEELTQTQRDNLTAASHAIDEITCSTIHGFCQRIIKPYPAEADIDPGAGIMDRTLADLTFLEIVDKWLREQLSSERGGVLAEMVLYSPAETVKLIGDIAENLRRRRALVAPTSPKVEPSLEAFRTAAAAFTKFLYDNSKIDEPETQHIARLFNDMAVQCASESGAVSESDTIEAPALVKLLVTRPHPDLCTKQGAFASYRKAGKWGDAARRAGFPTTKAQELNKTATDHYQKCCSTWITLQQTAASLVLAILIDEAREIIERYRAYKRKSALLDFDDLIFAARDLLRDHDEVRTALGKRFAHVLVDEFQDTDPLQTEIFWRLCGDPVESCNDWTSFRIRPGALFLVGDPKQAIYRFRGADVAAYVQAREAFRTQDPESLLSISTNFRSSASILTFINERFATPLSAEGQPGFTALEPFQEERGDLLRVVALDIEAAGGDGNASAERKRDAEAEAIAELCARMIGSQPVVDRSTGKERFCQPGDIALLAPTGTDLWRYEEALENRGIPVATQAGKGLFRRQEIQDLIALTRVLADRRDTLALGALLRGPVVGLTEEELLDIVWALPRSEKDPARVGRLDLSVDSEAIEHPLAQQVLQKLQSLARRQNSTTPHELLSQAVDVLRIRPILRERHQGQAERALANVDLYLSLSTRYAVRGLRAFAEAMTNAWEDEARAVEGRPDAQEEAVALVTMHAAKGLEWPIVIPINTMTGVKSADSAVIDRKTDTFYCKVFGVPPLGYDAAREAEKQELNRERIRLWYVATTRAREILVLPRHDTQAPASTWGGLVDLSLPELPCLDLSGLNADVASPASVDENVQTRESFAGEASQIYAGQAHLIWHQPSRDESKSGSVMVEEVPEVWMEPTDDQPREVMPTLIQGGRERGLILHKLMEEIITGETGTAEDALVERAEALIGEFGRMPVADPATGLSAKELASCVIRTLSLPEIAALLPDLRAEFPVYSASAVNGEETASVGIADALTSTKDGHPAVVIDWKSDVNPDAGTLQHYRSQVRAYLEMIGAQQGLIVLMTSGDVILVE